MRTILRLFCAQNFFLFCFVFLLRFSTLTQTVAQTQANLYKLDCLEESRRSFVLSFPSFVSLASALPL